ncbi:MAG: helix-turn-helix transcriptional regulator [Gulosibacter sp.]|uniref:helix-turn-helix transcriptional regulator n=1 Tax=Gulosibacter sp. TaxID=2817531 RepID=UPI003F8FECC9
MTQYTSRIRTPGDIGLAIQQARLSRGLSQSDLAKELDVSQSAISEIESGKATIYLRRILEIARLIDLDISATWEDEDAPRS